MQINKIQYQSDNSYYNPAFTAKLQAANKKLVGQFNNMFKKESKIMGEEFDLLYDRFSRLHKYDTLVMDIEFNQAEKLDEVVVNRIDSPVYLHAPIKKDGEYLYPIARILKETIENPSYKAIWEVSSK